MNEYSSRSHSILSLKINQFDHANSQKTTSILDIVDLAGSERMNKSQVVDKQEDEAKSINLSLTTLGKVIYALSCNYNHIPIRDSKLTKLLSNSLGNGNAFTVVGFIEFNFQLLINCSSSNINMEETISTLRFGQRAQIIRIKPKLNITKEDQLQYELIKLKNENKLLLKRTNSLQSELNSFQKNKRISLRRYNSTIFMDAKEKESITPLNIAKTLNEMQNTIQKLRLLKNEILIENQEMKEMISNSCSKISKVLSKNEEFDETNVVLKCGYLFVEKNKIWKLFWAIIINGQKTMKLYSSIKVNIFHSPKSLEFEEIELKKGPISVVDASTFKMNGIEFKVEEESDLEDWIENIKFITS
jgi:hypothetical protein